MKIAYVLSWELDREDGVSKKVLAQCSYMHASGHQVEVFNISRSGLPAKKLPYKIQLFKKSKSIYSIPGVIKSFSIFRGVHAAVKKFSPDLIYFRPELPKLGISKIFDLAPTVYELNTQELNEFKLLSTRSLKDRIKYYYYKLNISRLLNRMHGVVAVTSELAEQLNEDYPHLKCRVIPNSIDFDDQIEVRVTESDKMSFVFIGSPNQPWQGIDQIIKLARACDDKFKFNIIGVDDNGADHPSNVSFHGYLKREKYEKLLRSSDIGIGTLALYRKRMNEACPIKVREYLAYGLPIIIAYEDTAFLNDKPEWILQLPNHENSVLENKDAIISFAKRMKGRRLSKMEVAPFVHQDYIEQRRINFLEELVNDKK